MNDHFFHFVHCPEFRLIACRTLIHIIRTAMPVCDLRQTRFPLLPKIQMFNWNNYSKEERETEILFSYLQILGSSDIGVFLLLSEHVFNTIAIAKSRSCRSYFVAENVCERSCSAVCQQHIQN